MGLKRNIAHKTKTWLIVMIDFKGIHKTYPGEVPLHVLKGIDLHIQGREMRDVIDEVKASMQNNRQRIWLTGFAIGWGMFILVTLLGSAGGIQKGITRKKNANIYSI